MIEINIISKDPILICHRVPAIADRSVAHYAGKIVLETIKTALDNRKSPEPANIPVGLILDMRGYAITDLAAHKVWSTTLRQRELVKLVAKVAIVGNDSSTLRAEKELLSSDTLSFFVEFKSAVAWLHHRLAA